MRVLVTDAASKASLGITRSLGSKGINVGVLAGSSGELASYSRYCSTTYITPAPDEASFVPAVLNVLRRVRYDLLIPQGQAATLSLARHKARLSSLTKLEVADYDKIRSAANKRWVYELAIQAGLRVPHTVYPADLDHLKSLASELPFPAVIKQVRQAEDQAVYPCYVRTSAELPRAYRAFCAQKADAERNVLVQEFIPGYGCGFSALYQDGVCKRIFMHRRIRENPPTGKVSSCAESFYDLKLKEYGIRLLDLLGWHGVAMVEFRYDTRDETYKLMEINPRFWGSLDLALAAGADFPRYLCQIAQGEILECSEEYKRDLRYHWPLSEEIQHVWKRPSSVGAVVCDLLNPRVESNIWLRDLGPNLYECLSLAHSLARRVSGA